jgi:hypothetical protein
MLRIAVTVLMILLALFASTMILLGQPVSSRPRAGVD